MGTREVGCLLCVVMSVSVWAQETFGYVRKDCWHESLLASIERLEREESQAVQPHTIPNFGTDEFTIMAWIQTKDGGTIAAKVPKDGPWAKMGKAFFVRDGKLCFDIGWVGCVTSKRGVDDGQWHHVAVSSANDVQRLYIDGQLDAEGGLHSGADIAEHLVKVGYTAKNFPA